MLRTIATSFAIAFCSKAYSQEAIDLDFYRGYFSNDSSIIVLNAPKPIGAGDFLSYTQKSKLYRIHAFKNCLSNGSNGNSLVQKSVLAISTTNRSDDWFESIDISGSILGLGGSYSNTISRSDKIEFADGSNSNFRAYSEDLSIGTFDFFSVIDAVKCEKYLEWVENGPAKIIPESVFWFEGNLTITSTITLELEKNVSLSFEALKPITNKLPWASAILNSTSLDGSERDNLSKETKMVASFPEVNDNQRPSILAFRPLYIDQEIAEQISEKLKIAKNKFGSTITPDEAKAIVEEFPELSILKKGSLINSVFQPNKTKYSDWLYENGNITEEKLIISRNLTQAFYLNFDALN